LLESVYGLEESPVNLIQNCSERTVRSSSILNPKWEPSKIGNWQPRLFLFVPEESRRTVERLGNVCVVRHRVFLDDVGASYPAWQPMAGFEDMTKPFGLAREEST
jgi:hypothetical protein